MVFLVVYCKELHYLKKRGRRKRKGYLRPFCTGYRKFIAVLARTTLITLFTLLRQIDYSDLEATKTIWH